MKKLTLVIIFAALTMVCTSSISRAEDTVTGDVYLGMYNKYLFRGLDLSQNRLVSQFGADVNYKGFTLSYWSNLLTKAITTPITAKAGDITETDITLNYSFSPVKLVTFNVGNTFYSLEGSPDTNELYLKTTLNTLLSPTLSIYWDYDQARYAGLFYTLSASHTIELAKNLGLNLGALISYNQSNWSTSGNTPDNAWHNYELSAALNYAITGKLNASATYTYSNALCSKARNTVGIKDESLYGIKVAYNF